MDSHLETLARRGHRMRARGEFRKAALAYGELTGIEPENPRWWVLLGVASREITRATEARRAFRQAQYLFRQAGDTLRAGTMAMLVAALDDGPGSLSACATATRRPDQSSRSSRSRPAAA